MIVAMYRYTRTSGYLRGDGTRYGGRGIVWNSFVPIKDENESQHEHGLWTVVHGGLHPSYYVTTPVSATMIDVPILTGGGAVVSTVQLMRTLKGDLTADQVASLAHYGADGFWICDQDGRPLSVGPDLEPLAVALAGRTAQAGFAW